MKILHLRDKTTYKLEENVAEQIINQINNLKFVRLPSGDLINTTEIIKITEPIKNPYYGMRQLTQDLEYIFIDGNKVKFDKRNIDKVIFLSDEEFTNKVEQGKLKAIKNAIETQGEWWKSSVFYGDTRVSENEIDSILEKNKVDEKFLIEDHKKKMDEETKKAFEEIRNWNPVISRETTKRKPMLSREQVKKLLEKD